MSSICRNATYIFHRQYLNLKGWRLHWCRISGVTSDADYSIWLAVPFELMLIILFLKIAFRQCSATFFAIPVLDFWAAQMLSVVMRNHSDCSLERVYWRFLACLVLQWKAYLALPQNFALVDILRRYYYWIATGLWICKCFFFQFPDECVMELAPIFVCGETRNFFLQMWDSWGLPCPHEFVTKLAWEKPVCSLNLA